MVRQDSKTPDGMAGGRSRLPRPEVLRIRLSCDNPVAQPRGLHPEGGKLDHPGTQICGSVAILTGAALKLAAVPQ